MKIMLSAGSYWKNKKSYILDHKIKKNGKPKIKTNLNSRSWIFTLMQVFKTEKFNFQLHNSIDFAS